jgi:hypothetical protein
MENIHNPNDKFDFEKLILTKPTAIADDVMEFVESL